MGTFKQQREDYADLTLTALEVTKDLLRACVPVFFTVALKQLQGYDVGGLIRVCDACRKYNIQRPTLNKIIARGALRRYARGVISELELARYLEHNTRIPDFDRFAVEVYLEEYAERFSYRKFDATTIEAQAIAEALADEGLAGVIASAKQGSAHHQ